MSDIEVLNRCVQLNLLNRKALVNRSAYNDQSFPLVTFVTSPGQLSQLLEQALICVGEVEAGFSLHTFLELGGHPLEQFRACVDRHQVIGDVPFANPGSSKPHLPTLTAGGGRSDQLTLVRLSCPEVKVLDGVLT